MVRRCLMLAALLSWAGCEQREEVRSAEPVRLRVGTASYPLACFARRLAGDRAEVRCVLPPGQDPRHWQPDREIIARLQQSDLILLNGASFESWAPLIHLPQSRIVHTSAAFADEWIAVDGATHSHGRLGRHTHAATDPYVWLDPVNARRQAEAVFEALSRRLPHRQERMRENLTTLVAELDALGRSFEQLTPQLRPVELFATRPVFNYLARRYGWSIRTIATHDGDSWSHPAHPDEASTARILLWTGDGAALWRLSARRDVRGVLFLPGDRVPPDGQDYLEMMRANLDRLRQALAGSE